MSDKRTDTAPAPIMIEHATGSIEINPAEFFPCTAAKLRQLVTLAEKHREETINQIREYLEAAREPYANSKNKDARKEAARWSALLEVLDPPAKKSSAVKVAEKIARRNDVRKDYQGVFTSGGKYCVCDGYSLIRFNDPIPLPQVPGGLDAAKSIEGARRADIPLKLPTPKEARSLLKIARAAGAGEWSGRVYALPGRPRRAAYNFGDGLPVVNLEFLIDIMEALPGCKAYASGPAAPIYFEAPNGDGLILPIKLKPEAIAHRPEAAAAAPETMTPEEFAERLSPAMTPEEFAAAYAA